jgi:SAM-dependent methyltransferase
MKPVRLADAWEQGSSYEAYIGRWSRRVAPKFLAWLDPRPGLRWLDVGCGTGALSAAILARHAPASVVAIDPSAGFLALAREQLGDRARLLAGDAAALPVEAGSCDLLVSGLVLNFVSDLPAALAEMRRVLVAGGEVAAYVWDYADAMQITRRFWDAAVALDPTAAPLHEALRFPLCRPDALRAAFNEAGLVQVETTALELEAHFISFDDYWRPFLGGQGPAPAYAMSLAEAQRERLRARLASTLPVAADGSIALQARAWAVRGRVPPLA